MRNSSKRGATVLCSSLGLLALLACSSSSGEGGSDAGAQTAAVGDAGDSAGGSATGGTHGGGTGGTAAGGASGGTANNGGAGAENTGGTGGSSGAADELGGAGGNGGGATDPLYPPPPREIVIEPNRGNQTISFRAEDADPEATSYHGDTQRASFDAGATVIRKKLVIGLHGIGNGPGPGGALSFAASRGFHTLALDYYNNKSGGPQGAGYLEIWDGEDHSPDIEVPKVNSVRHRVESGLAYLVDQDPGADWGYYLNEDGSVRWSDVIAFGYSFGAQTGAAGTRLDAMDKVIATSGPGLDANAPWISGMPALTPGDRGWALFDPGDAQERKATAANALGWPGEPVDTDTVPPPYNGSHVLLLGGGHSEFCSRPDFDVVCDFVFGVSAP